MNIGVDIKALRNKTTGICKYIRCILDELQRLDTENRYYLFECKLSNYEPVNPNWKKFSQMSKLPATIWQQLTLPVLLRKYNIDILWAPEQICPILRVPSSTKIVTTIHDFVITRYPKTSQTTDRLIKKLLAGPTIKKAAAIVPVSDRIKKELIDFFPYIPSTSKIVRTVNNGANARDNTPKPSTERKNFLFFPGNMEPRKNLTRLITALEIVNKSGFELGLHICGPEGWKNSGLRTQIESSSIRERIRHLGYLPEPDLLNQYLTCAALVYPSFYEGFGIPVLEALRLDTPVLTSKDTVMEEIAGANAMYFDPYDVDSIAGTIIRFLEAGGPVIDHASLDRYTWRRSAEDLLEVFNELGRQQR